MKYLKLYESYFETPESENFNYVWQCIENSYPNKVDLNDLIISATKEKEITKDSWIRIVFGCLSDEDKKEVGNLFIKNFIKGEKNKYFFAFLYTKLKYINPKISDLLKNSFNL